jgi:hypothetical protein
MKRLVLSFSAAWLLSVATASAQEPAASIPPVAIAPAADLPGSGGQADLWQYQRREANDPMLAVRANAAFKGRQRRERMESRKWYGYSVARPIANPVPHVSGDYSPAWTGNTGIPYEWSGDAVVPSLSVSKRPVKKTLR